MLQLAFYWIVGFAASIVGSANSKITENYQMTSTDLGVSFFYFSDKTILNLRIEFRPYSIQPSSSSILPLYEFDSFQ